MTEHQYQRSPEALHAAVGDDIVALHVRNGLCFGMENVTADVWRLIEQPRTFDEICAGLLDEYDVDAETCRSEVVALLATMEQQGLVERVAKLENGN